MIRYTSGYRNDGRLVVRRDRREDKNAMRWLISEWFNKRLLDTGMNGPVLAVGDVPVR
jgi:hypothetical protein